MGKKTIGIIGGMGSLATADLFKKIVLNTKAEKDQEHIKILIDNNTDIPDRTEAIIRNGKDPVPQLAKSALKLWTMGAELLIIPCNTAHYFREEVQKSVEIPVLSMIELTGEAVLARGINAVGLLATEGTVKSGIYQTVFEKLGIKIITPDESGQSAVTDLIYKGVKAGNTAFDVTKVHEVIRILVNRGAETLVLGCTELPVAVEMYGLDYDTCDPTLELARGAIRAAGGECI